MNDCMREKNDPLRYDNPLVFFPTLPLTTMTAPRSRVRTNDEEQEWCFFAYFRLFPLFSRFDTLKNEDGHEPHSPPTAAAPSSRSAAGSGFTIHLRDVMQIIDITSPHQHSSYTSGKQQGCLQCLRLWEGVFSVFFFGKSVFGVSLLGIKVFHFRRPSLLSSTIKRVSF